MSDPSKDNKPKPPGPDDQFEWKKAAKTIGFWAILILTVIIVLTYMNPQQGDVREKSFTEYWSLLEAGKIESATVEERRFIGVEKGPGDKQTRQFITILPLDETEQLEKWQEKGIELTFKEKDTNWLGVILTSVLPWVILIGFWIFLMRRMQGGGTKGIFSFGKSRAKLMLENKPKVTFDDVAGAEEAKEELQEVIQFLKDPKKFERLGGRIPKGALLVGPPGTGKTLLGRAIAGEAGVPFFSMSGADFVEMFVGVGASRVRDLFDQGKKHAPCIIFIDEIDAVGRQRGAGLGGGHDEREQTLNQLLVEMDGFEENVGVILLAATNRPDVLDPALLRPGRFDRQIVVDRPDVRGRHGILKVHARKVPLDEDVNLEILAKGTPGFSGADLANMVNEAALLAARRDTDKVTMRDFEDAKDKVMMGAERRSMVISEDEKKLTAYHEAGHALVGMLTPGSDPVHKVTIIPRGRALGVTSYLPIDEKHSWSKKYIEGKLLHLMGGRAAERLIFDDYTNGAASDIKQATGIARKMVCDWGMSEKIGPLALGHGSEEVFLGREIGQGKTYSEATAIEVDREIKRIVLTAQNTAVELLEENLDALHNIANGLLEREILDGDEVEMILTGKELPPPEKRDKTGPRKPRKMQDRKRLDATFDEDHAPPDADTGEEDVDEDEDDTTRRLKQVDDVLARLDDEEKEPVEDTSDEQEREAAVEKPDEAGEAESDSSQKPRDDGPLVRKERLTKPRRYNRKEDQE